MIGHVLTVDAFGFGRKLVGRIQKRGLLYSRRSLPFPLASPPPSLSAPATQASLTERIRLVSGLTHLEGFLLVAIEIRFESQTIVVSIVGRLPHTCQHCRFSV